MDIYQEIWDADQAGNGVKAIAAGSPVTPALAASGFVTVDESEGGGPDHTLMPEVNIPVSKRSTYDLTEALFNNYFIDQTKREETFFDEEFEVQLLLEQIHKLPPMEIARKYCESRTGEMISTDAWWAILERVWFEQFDMGNNKDLSGFEHVIAGEMKQGKVQGYHYWYKWHLDENFVIENDVLDLITFDRFKNTSGETSPDVVTLEYKWEAFDYKEKKFRPLKKPIGGFWVGPSIEGLMAIGTVRFLQDVMAPKEAVINGVRYKLQMFRSQNNRNMRTFYPEAIGMA